MGNVPRGTKTGKSQFDTVSNWIASLKIIDSNKKFREFSTASPFL
jgi:hypothetical protein